MKGSALDVKTMLGKPQPPWQSTRTVDSEFLDTEEVFNDFYTTTAPLVTLALITVLSFHLQLIYIYAYIYILYHVCIVSII